MMMQLTLIRGIPGSGKSTLAIHLANSVDDGQHVEADQYFVDVNGNYVWDRNSLAQAHKWCQDQTDKYLGLGQNVFVSNTFTTVRELKPYFLIAKAHGITPNVITCETEWGNVHNVPHETLLAMKGRFEHRVDSLFKLLEG